MMEWIIFAECICLSDPGIECYLKKSHLIYTLFLWWKDQYCFVRGNEVSLSGKVIYSSKSIWPHILHSKRVKLFSNSSLFVINIHLTNIWGWIEIRTRTSVCNLSPPSDSCQSMTPATASGRVFHFFCWIRVTVTKWKLMELWEVIR